MGSARGPYRADGVFSAWPSLAKGLLGVGCHLFWTGFLVGFRGWLLLVFDPVGEFL